jgi:hypothetical protein
MPPPTREAVEVGEHVIRAGSDQPSEDRLRGEAGDVSRIAAPRCPTAAGDGDRYEHANGYGEPIGAHLQRSDVDGVAGWAREEGGRRQRS